MPVIHYLLSVSNNVRLKLAVCLIALAGNRAIAQTTACQQEFSISYGMVSGRQVLDYLSLTRDGGGISDNTTSGSPFITYRYFLSDNFTIGLALGNQFIDGSVSSVGSPGVFISNFTLRNTSIVPEITWNYINRKYFQAYGIFGAGVAIYDYMGYSDPGNLPQYDLRKKGIRPNFQFSPSCYKFGGQLSGFFELGIGYKGLLNVGCSYRMGTQKTHRHRDPHFGENITPGTVPESK